MLLHLLPLLILLTSCIVAVAEIKVEPQNYQVDGKQYQGYLAYDDNVAGKAPGVLVFPEWWGANGYAKRRAQMLAQLGYVAFVVDMYGEGKTTTDPTEAKTLASSVYSNPDVLLKRAQAGLDTLRQSDRADSNRLAAIGYCMGGGIALNLARSGADLKAVVGFHCGLANIVKQTGKIKAKILVCEGADDKSLSDQEQQAFKDEMRNAKIDWEYVVFGNALHAFTNPEADKHKDLGIGYNQNADRRSWQLMRDFLAEALDHRPQAAAERGIPSAR